jgi:general secretion pathway protein A
MYKEYYGLQDKPFTLTPDTKYLYPGSFHKEALDCLSSGIKNDSRLVILTGEIGSGKTLLLRSHVKELSQAFKVIYVFYPTSSCMQLLQMILLNISIKTIHSKLDMLREELKKQLIKSIQAKKRPILVIDEAQNLDKDALSEIIELTKLKENNERLLSVILVGLPELQNKLSSHYSPGADNVPNYHLKNLPEKDIPKYIHYRLTKAGCSDLSVFPDGIINEIGAFSKGTPRLINMICESLLIAGYTSNEKTITAAVLKEVLDNMFYKAGQENDPQKEQLKASPGPPSNIIDIPDDMAHPLPLTLIVLEKNARMKVHLENELRKNGFDFIMTTELEELFARLDQAKDSTLQVAVVDASLFFDEGGQEDTVGNSALDRIQTSYTHLPLIMTAALPLTAMRTKLFQRGIPFLLKKPDLSRVDLSEVSARFNNFFDELKYTLTNIHSQFDAFYHRVIKWGYERNEK